MDLAEGMESVYGDFPIIRKILPPFWRTVKIHMGFNSVLYLYTVFVNLP